MIEYRGWVAEVPLLWRDTRDDAQADIDLYRARGGTEKVSIEEGVADSDT